MKRRGFLAGCVGVAAFSAGCNIPILESSVYQREHQGYSLVLGEKSTHFESVGIIRKPDIIGVTGTVMSVTLNSGSSNVLSAVVLAGNGAQYGYTTVPTGARTVAFMADFFIPDHPNRTLNLLAVEGGQGNGFVYTGGRILERVPVEFKKTNHELKM